MFNSFTGGGRTRRIHEDVDIRHYLWVPTKTISIPGNYSCTMLYNTKAQKVLEGWTSHKNKARL